jgi:Flp pilus assembly pilin Flp
MTFHSLCSRTAQHLAKFRAEDRGAVAIEYALVASGVALAVSGVILNLGSSVKTNLFEKLANLMP